MPPIIVLLSLKKAWKTSLILKGKPLQEHVYAVNIDQFIVTEYWVIMNPSNNSSAGQKCECLISCELDKWKRQQQHL